MNYNVHMSEERITALDRQLVANDFDVETDEGGHRRRTCFAMMFRWISSEPPAMLAARPSK